MKRISILLSILILNIISTNTLFSQDSLFKDISPDELEIILLGEQSHGDGAVFDKKFEMVKELHENYGYNLLVFESGMYDNFKANELYQNKQESIKIFNQSVGWLYTTTKVFQELLNYLETHPEMKILGFDSQESNLFEEYFLDDFKTLCSKNRIEVSNETYIEIEKTMVVRDIEKYAFNKKDSTNLYNIINSIIEKINLIPKQDIKTRVLVQTFKSVFSDLDFGIKSLQKEKIAIQNPRDKQMAENLIFIKETYPNEKLMGWGASYHFANKLNEFEYTVKTEEYIKKQVALTDSIYGESFTSATEEIAQIKELKSAVPMGQILKEKYGDKLFSLAFTSYNGNYFNIEIDQSAPILRPPSNSIESDFKNQDKNYKLFILKDKSDKFYSSALGYIPLYVNWSNIFDGIYYIENMYVPNYINYDNTITETVNYDKSKIIKGSIFDQETSEPINYADIYYSDLNSSTVSNATGQFNIVHEKNANGYLVFSAMGYVSDSISTKSIHDITNIKLRKSKNDIILNEVVISAKRIELSAEDIVKKAQKNIETNYFQNPYNQNFLFQVSQFSTNDSLQIGEEAIIKTFNKKGINGSTKPENNIFGKIEHLRTNTTIYDKNKWDGVGSMWVVLNRDIILSKTNVLYRTASYDLEKQRILNYEGQKVYQINFTNNSPGSYSTGFGYPAPVASSGSIYIDTENYAVLKYEHIIERPEYETKKTKKLVKQKHHIVQTYKNINGKYFFNVLELTTTADIFSMDHQLLNTKYFIDKIVSENIVTNEVHMLSKPLLEIKKGYQIKKNDTFWNDKPMDFQSHMTSNKI